MSISVSNPASTAQPSLALAPSQAEIRIADYAGNPTWGSQACNYEGIKWDGEKGWHFLDTIFFSTGKWWKIYNKIVAKGRGRFSAFLETTRRFQVSNVGNMSTGMFQHFICARENRLFPRLLSLYHAPGSQHRKHKSWT